MQNLWDAKAYSEFLDYRTRPAKDLLFAVPDSVHPRIVYDLGCGPGNSTILLKNRWPDANVIGIDSSLNMLQQAETHYPQLKFIQQDIADFSTNNPVDCLFANASLQWLDHHDVLIPQLISYLNSGGVLAIQMPNNFHSLMHQTVVELLQQKTAWQPYLKALRYGALHKPFYQLADYYDIFSTSGMSHIQLWETDYLQEISSYQAIYDWLKGTGLRPVLTQMDADAQRQFEEEYVAAVSTKYTLQKNHKILLPYKRLFIVGIRI